MHASVTSIGKFSFLRCGNLENVTFENPEGWKTGNTNLTLDNPQKNAEYVRDSAYCNAVWTRQ